MAHHAGLLGQQNSLSPPLSEVGLIVLSMTTKTAHLIFYRRNAKIDTTTKKGNKWLEMAKV